MILPSLLEYSTEELESKLAILHQYPSKIKKLTKQRSLSLHIDWVMKYFAQSRSTMMSLDAESVLTTLLRFYSTKKLTLSIHCMGDSEDLLFAYRFFEKYKFNNKWDYTIYVQEKYFNLWKSAFHLHTKIGIWYDLDEWQEADFYPQYHYLLMTVLAGKSGQVSSEQSQKMALDICRNNMESSFILDGGWKINQDIGLDNCMIVSYSDFWKTVIGVSGN